MEAFDLTRGSDPCIEGPCKIREPKWPNFTVLLPSEGLLIISIHHMVYFVIYENSIEVHNGRVVCGGVLGWAYCAYFEPNLLGSITLGCLGV